MNSEAEVANRVAGFLGTDVVIDAESSHFKEKLFSTASVL